MTEHNNMLWGVRCVIAWTFRALEFVVVYGALGAIVYFKFHDPAAFSTVIPPTFISGVVLVFLFIVLTAAFELLGGLLSWTNPLDDLPRFRDTDRRDRREVK